jgi:hypothetical protein
MEEEKYGLLIVRNHYQGMRTGTDDWKLTSGACIRGTAHEAVQNLSDNKSCKLVAPAVASTLLSVLSLSVSLLLIIIKIS